MIPHMRTGTVGFVDEEDTSHLDTVAATLRVFMKDAIRVAGRYSIACNRKEVCGNDMKLALMYCARTFFERDDDTLLTHVAHERELMAEEEEEEGEEGDDEDEDEDEEGDEEEGDEDEEGEEEDLTVTPADIQLRHNVDTVAKSWTLWEPDDPVHQLIKRSIDNTPVS
jgi:hypothetical protein